MTERGAGDEQYGIYDLSPFYEFFPDDEDLSLEQKLSQAMRKLEFDAEKALPKLLYETISLQAQSLGTPIDYVLMPFIAIVANVMNGSLVEVNAPKSEMDKGHVEPVIVNVLVLGNKSTNKTAAFKVFEEILADIETKNIAKAKEQFDKKEDDSGCKESEKNIKKTKVEFNPTLHKIFLKKCTESGLISQITKQNSNKNIVLMYEEFLFFQNLLDFSNTKNSFLAIFLESYGGSTIRCLTQTRGLEEAEKPCIQSVVCAQPLVFVQELSKNPDDPSGTWERTLPVCPPRLIVNLEDCHRTRVSKKADLARFVEKIKEGHEEKGQIYRFDEPAIQFLYKIDRDMKSQMWEDTDDSELGGIYGKDIQKIERVAGIFCEMRNVSLLLDPSHCVVNDILDLILEDVVALSLHQPEENKEHLHTKIARLNQKMKVAIKEENFRKADSLKKERDILLDDELLSDDYYSHDKGSLVPDERYTIRKKDVESAMYLILYCSGTSIQLKRAAREVASLNKSKYNSPLKMVKKARRTNYWAEDTSDVVKSFDFVMKYSEKVVKIFENAKDGEISIKLVQSKRMFPLPSSSRPRGFEVDKSLATYFMEVLVNQGIVLKIDKEKTKAFLPQDGSDIEQEVEKKFLSLRKKHPNFKPFL